MIYLIRHGKTDFNKRHIVQGQSDTNLSCEGVKQINEFSEKLRKLNIKFDSFYSSPLKRAKNTLKIIMDNLGYKNEIIIDEGLIERRFGKAEGKNYYNPILLSRILHNKIKGMETDKELENRMYNVILNIAKSNVNKNVLIVSHSHSIKGFLRNLDKTIKYMEKSSNLSMNIVDYKIDDFKIIELNKNLI